VRRRELHGTEHVSNLVRLDRAGVAQQAVSIRAKVGPEFAGLLASGRASPTTYAMPQYKAASVHTTYLRSVRPSPWSEPLGPSVPEGVVPGGREHDVQDREGAATVGDPTKVADATVAFGRRGEGPVRGGGVPRNQRGDRSEAVRSVGGHGVHRLQPPAAAAVAVTGNGPGLGCGPAGLARPNLNSHGGIRTTVPQLCKGGLVADIDTLRRLVRSMRARRRGRVGVTAGVRVLDGEAAGAPVGLGEPVMDCPGPGIVGDTRRVPGGRTRHRVGVHAEHISGIGRG